MRIRSIKPEFWRSDDIDALAWDQRLVFVGLWSYVDDNGVGLDKLASVCADLFAGDMERDPNETLNRVSTALKAFAERGLIQRYSADGKAYLYISGWKHQRVVNPNKERYPRPLTSDYAESSESLNTEAQDASEILSPVTGEQGNRGTEEKESGDAPPRSHSARKRPRSQLPADWAPTDAHHQVASARGIDIEREAKNFRLHAEETDRRAVVWNSAFSRWLENARPRAINSGSSEGGRVWQD